MDEESPILGPFVRFVRSRVDSEKVAAMSDERGETDHERPWWRKKRWLVPGGIVGLLLLLIAVSPDQGVPQERHDEVVAEREDARDRVAQLESELEDTSEQLDEAESEAETAMERAREQAEEELADRREEAEQELAERREQLEQRTAQLDEREAQLDEREAAVQEAEEIEARSTFGDGTYEVGVDIPPGTYRADAGSSQCYWAKLSNDAERDIQQNSLI